MARFMISYVGGEHPATPEEGKRHFEKYMAWLSGLGDAATSPANPLGNTHVIGPDGDISAGGLTSMSGFTIVEAESMEAALALAADCPFLDIRGSLEVSELMPMPGAG